jgi:hypothetical protein
MSMRVKYLKDETMPDLVWMTRLELGRYKRTAMINHATRTVRPCHGYYPNHKFAALNRRIAYRMNYQWLG